jgi:chromate reductase, NAD(P)H dehydrogenase (quinone)
MFGAVWAQAELRKVAAALGARLVGSELPVGHAPACFEGEQLADEALRERVAALLEELVAEARRLEAVAA